MRVGLGVGGGGCESPSKQADPPPPPPTRRRIGYKGPYGPHKADWETRVGISELRRLGHNRDRVYETPLFPYSASVISPTPVLGAPRSNLGKAAISHRRISEMGRSAIVVGDSADRYFGLSKMRTVPTTPPHTHTHTHTHIHAQIEAAKFPLKYSGADVRQPEHRQCEMREGGGWWGLGGNFETRTPSTAVPNRPTGGRLGAAGRGRNFRTPSLDFAAKIRDRPLNSSLQPIENSHLLDPRNQMHRLCDWAPNRPVEFAQRFLHRWIKIRRVRKT